jgi:hypothetical protein
VLNENIISVTPAILDEWSVLKGIGDVNEQQEINSTWSGCGTYGRLGGISGTMNRADFSSSALIEGLQIEAVSAIMVTSEKGEKTMTLSRAGAGFVVTDKDNYPADVATINGLFNGCLDIRTQEKITDNPDNHADLEVTLETAKSVVTFLDSARGEIVGVALSKSNEKNEAFVRLLSEASVYSIQYPPQINTHPMDYVDAQLLQVSQDQMSSVAVRTGEDRYVLTASEDGSDIVLQDMPAGKQYKGTDYKTVFGALSSLRCQDVVSAENAPEELEFDSVYTCKLKDKTVYKLTLAHKDETTYVKLTAEFLGQTPTKEQGVESEEQLKEKEAILLAIDAVNQFNQKHSPEPEIEEGIIEETAGMKSVFDTAPSSDQ